MSKKFHKDEYDDEFPKGKKRLKPRQINPDWYPYEVPIIDVGDERPSNDSSEDSTDQNSS